LKGKVKMIENRDWLLTCLACPICKKNLKQQVRLPENNEIKEGALLCGHCNKSYSIKNFIPVLLSDAIETKKEGIAVKLDNAVSVFKKEIDPESRKSGRLFDDDLNNKNQVFLDIGCGIGRHLLVLRNNGIKKYLGFDIVYDLVCIARKEFSLKTTFVANALHIPLADNSIDRCLLYNAIEHCSDTEGVLREISRILRDGGILYMDVPNAKSTGDRLFRWGGLIMYGKTSHIQKFTWKKINRLIDRGGLRILECKTTRGIFVDYPQLERFGLIRKILKVFFGNELSGWELKLGKKT